MSCGALVDEKAWIYLTRSDVAHDTALCGSFSFFFLAVGLFVSSHKGNLDGDGECSRGGTLKREQRLKQRVGALACSALLCVVPMLVLVNWCPVLPPSLRLTLLGLETAALVFAQRAQLLISVDER